MELDIFNDEQGSEAWLSRRAGIPTASMFGTIMAKGVKGGESKTRRTYLLKTAGEILTGKPSESFTNVHMDRGHVMEPDARNLYAMVADVEPELVGFLRRGRAGGSPDSLVGADGLLEIKTRLPHLQLEVLLADEVPSEHRAQIQGCMWISGRQWCDFVSYWPGLPLFIKRAERDEEYINRIASAVAEFNAELDMLVAKFQPENQS